MNIHLLALTGIAIASVSQLHGETGHRKALVIGNNNYLHANVLLNATNDARDVANVLVTLGYSVTRALNVSRSRLNDTVTLFDQSLASGDMAVIYYSGHGFQVEGENYLVPIDFNATTAIAGQAQGYSLSKLFEQMTSRGAAIQIVILDACRDNPFFSSKSTQSGWAKVGAPGGTLIAYGTAPGSTASDNPNQPNGLYTKALLSHISSLLPIEAMLKEVGTDTILASFGAQVPWFASSISGEVYLNPKAENGGSSKGVLSMQDQLSSRSLTVAPQPDFGNHGILLSEGTLPAPDLKSADVLVQQGLLLVRQGDYSEAVRSLSAALALRPGFSIALRVLGLIFNLLGRTADSIAQFSRAISVDPTDHLAYYYRCSALTERDPLNAIRDCEASIGLAPTFLAAHLALANAMLTAGNTEAALREINVVLESVPESARAHALRGQIYEELGQHEDASKETNRAVRLAIALKP